MRIRKRTQSVAVTTSPLSQPLSFKYHTGLSPPGSQGRFGGTSVKHSEAAKCSSSVQVKTNRGVQEEREERGLAELPRFDLNAERPALDSLRLSDAHVEEDRDEALSGPLVEDDVTVVSDKVRRRQASPKRRKIEHESSLRFEGSASMTAAELLVVNELANAVRLRLHAASEHSATTEVTKTLPSKPVENSKDALISSIFFVFGTCGENGLSASEVVKYMLDHRLPGLKEGGARHTVQVANVLRSSSSFISLGDKKYLLCSSLDAVSRPEPHRKPSSGQPVPKPSPASSSPRKQESSENEDAKQGSSENEDVSPQQKPRIREQALCRNSHSRSSRKPEPEQQVSLLLQDERKPSDGEPELPVVVRTARRRGPSSSQRGKGPTQCKRYDGRGWQCSRLTEPGYSLCVHHQDLINKRAAKLKEQQTLSRLMESQHRKLAKTPTQTQTQKQQQEPPPMESPKAGTATENANATGKQASRDSAAPVQKRKMLSLLAIK